MILEPTAAGDALIARTAGEQRRHRRRCETSTGRSWRSSGSRPGGRRRRSAASIAARCGGQLTARQVGQRLSLLARHGFAVDIDRDYMAPTHWMITDADEDAFAERTAGPGDDGAAGERPRPAAA